jgi:hypothetical protein
MSQFPTSHKLVEYSKKFVASVKSAAFVLRDSVPGHLTGALLMLILMLPPTWLTFLLKPATLTSKHPAGFHLFLA